MKILSTTLLLLIICSSAIAQCTFTPSQVYNFSYGGQTYEIIKANRNWSAAAACAVSRGGHLAEINSAGEQNAIYNAATLAGITLSNTTAADGGGASYLWLGGNDITTEGSWGWDGDNDNTSSAFWLGNASASAVGGSYTNWGNEPDNFNNQDAVALALTQWPLSTGSLGSASQWNDVDVSNSLYFVVEFPVVALPLPTPTFNLVPNINDKSVSILWNADNQFKGINIVEYSIEKSKNNEAFQHLVSMNANEKSENRPHYKYTDHTVKAGVSYYYRIVATNQEGSLQFSQSKTIRVGETTKPVTSVYPNPAQSEVNFTFEQIDNSQVNLIIYDITGEVVLKRSILQPSEPLTLSLAHLNGIYIYNVIYTENGKLIQEDRGQLKLFK